MGVGLVYWPALTPLFECGEAAVLELEPQTLWKKSSRSSSVTYELNEELFESVAGLPQSKLLHGVGQPVAGTVDDPTEYMSLLRHMASRLEPPWVSEHLSFNRIQRNGRVTECGFLLPPAQTLGAARVAARNVRRYATALRCPVAFETGVNYVGPVSGHIDDGPFVSAVAELADCGILLDLHNLWCNERNGRQPVLDAVAAMPLDRVWEVHFAGGTLLDGIWLDAHSGGIAPELVDLAAEIIPRLPNVGALIFEVLPEHLNRLGLDGVHRQLELLRSLWSTRPVRHTGAERTDRRGRWLSSTDDVPPSLADIAEVSAWESRLMTALNDESFNDPLAADPGCSILRQLIQDARRASLARGFRFTTTALLAGLGQDLTARLVSEYLRSAPPDAFVAMECYQFARFLSSRPRLVASVPYLGEVMAYEEALLKASLFGEATEVHWTVDPAELLEALDSGRLPQTLRPSPSRMTISA